MALIEALVASAVLGIGLAGATRLTLHALQSASDTRQHTVAQTLALDAMDCLQSGQALCDMNRMITVQGTRYTLQSQLRPRADLALFDIEVRVQWTAVGRPQTSRLDGTATQGTSQWVLHGSRDQVPAWVGVSLP